MVRTASDQIQTSDRPVQQQLQPCDVLLLQSQTSKRQVRNSRVPRRKCIPDKLGKMAIVHASPHTDDKQSLIQISAGRKMGSNSGPGLERADLGIPSEEIVSKKGRIRLGRGSVKTRKVDGEERPEGTSWEALHALISEQFKRSSKRVINERNVREMVELADKEELRCRKGLRFFVQLAQVLKWKEEITCEIIYGYGK
jgi:hypothetical protein